MLYSLCQGILTKMLVAYKYMKQFNFPSHFGSTGYNHSRQPQLTGCADIQNVAVPGASASDRSVLNLAKMTNA